MVECTFCLCKQKNDMKNNFFVQIECALGLISLKRYQNHNLYSKSSYILHRNHPDVLYSGHAVQLYYIKKYIQKIIIIKNKFTFTSWPGGGERRPTVSWLAAAPPLSPSTLCFHPPPSRGRSRGVSGFSSTNSKIESSGCFQKLSYS